MFRNAKVFVLTVGLVVSSAVVTSPAHAVTSPSGAAAAAASPSPRPVAAFTPGENQTVKLGARLTFDGTASTDPDGGTLRYEWRSTGRRKIASTKSVYSRRFTEPGRHKVQLTVINESGKRSTKKIWVTVEENLRPVAAFTPGTDQTVEVGQSLTFDGSVSSDPDGDALRYQWRSTGVPRVASWESTYSRTFDEPGRHKVKLTVVDESGLRNSTQIWVTVTQSGPPIVVIKTKNVVEPPNAFYVDIGYPFTLDASKSFDPDGGPLTFEWRLTESESGKSLVISQDAKFNGVIDDDFSYWDAYPDGIVLTVTDDEGDVTTVEKEFGLVYVD